MDDTQRQFLVEKAIVAARNAYAPYSNYQVGAALYASSGAVYSGCNVENAAYPATICAERTALVKAVSEGEREFECIVVATHNGGFPCGTCRQMLYEFSPELLVIICDFEGQIQSELSLSALLPHAFGPGSLQK